MIKVVDRVPTFPNRIKITREDGTSEYVTWERADEPTVAGTPINKALFDSIAADMGLSSNVTIYVSNAGSDTLGDGSSTNPYATIQRAINELPKNLNGYDATINIATGTYNEDLLIDRFFGGIIILDGASGVSVNIRSIRVHYGASVQVQNIIISVQGASGGNAIAVADASFVAISNIATTGAVENGVFVSRNGFFCAYGELLVKSTTYAALHVTSRSSLFATTLSLDASSGTALRCVNGSLVSYNTLYQQNTMPNFTSAGGRILTGAQT